MKKNVTDASDDRQILACAEQKLTILSPVRMKEIVTTGELPIYIKQIPRDSAGLSSGKTRPRDFPL